MAIFSADQALSKANSYLKKGKVVEAAHLYDEVLQKFPKNERAKNGIVVAHENLAKGYLATLISLYHDEKYNIVANKTKILVRTLKYSYKLWSLFGNASLGEDKLEEAMYAFYRVMSIKPDEATAYQNMTLVLKRVTFTKPVPSMYEVINSMLHQKTLVRPRDVSRAAISLLKSQPSIKTICKKYPSGKLKKSVSEVIAELSEKPLLLTLMSLCPLADLELEKCLKKIRCDLLLSLSMPQNFPKASAFQTSLALQCFTNEYIYSQTNEENFALEALDLSVNEMLLRGKQPSPQAVLCLASYKALNEYKWCELLQVNKYIKEIFTRQIIEPKKEQLLKKDIPAFQEINDKVSSKVRGQYEKNPYPRWVTTELHPSPCSISEVLTEKKLKLYDLEITKVKKPEILIAGCGTGQHSLSIAAQFLDAKILAVDLSLSSLAYAKRKTAELGFDNIKYMHADILQLRGLETQFNIIESVGVLHHMKNPMEGWQKLTDCLRPNGLMKIGLYSKLARQGITKIRNEIRASKIEQDDRTMRSFRETLIASKKECDKDMFSSLDAYSMSEFRDLLFHVQEHQFTISEIKQCLAQLQLNFCGFDDQAIVQKFKTTNKGPKDIFDLDKWQIYETSNPTTFAGMYVFWCQKIY